MVKPKVIDLEDVSGIIEDGSDLGVGGCLFWRKPMALIREIVKSEKKDLDIYTFLGTVGCDMLIGAGCVKNINAAYVGFEADGMSPSFLRKFKQKEVNYNDYSEWTLLFGYRAAALGLSFLPTTSALGSQVMEIRNFKTIECPYTSREYVAVPEVNVDTAIIHAVRSDKYGNMQAPVDVDFLEEHDVLLAKAADEVILSVEEIVSTQEIREAEDYRTLLFTHDVDYVVEAPKGAHPTALYTEYGRDVDHISYYLSQAKEEETFNEYVEKFIKAPETINGYMEAVEGVKSD